MFAEIAIVLGVAACVFVWGAPVEGDRATGTARARCRGCNAPVFCSAECRRKCAAAARG